MSWRELKPCGGCGESDPSKRCMGCFHDFGDDSSLWTQKVTRPARTPDPAQIRADALRELLMVERIDDVSDVCKTFRLSEPHFRAALRALIDTTPSPTAVDNGPAPDAGGKEGV